MTVGLIADAMPSLLALERIAIAWNHVSMLKLTEWHNNGMEFSK